MSIKFHHFFSNATMDHGEELTRNEIRKIPDGSYHAEMFLDQDGNDDKILDEAVKIHVTVKVKCDKTTLDFTGSNPQLKGPMNCPKPATISAARYGFKYVTTPHSPTMRTASGH